MKNYYVIDDDTNEVLVGPLSEESAEDYVDNHTNCSVAIIEEY